jgi:hypothetical protein
MSETKCTKCSEFEERFRCNAPDECDCPKCQGLCECSNSTWVMFTKRTEDPKLAWLERVLDGLSIPHRRNHAPILEVPEFDLDKAYAILGVRVGRYTIDDIRDDHPRWSYPITKQELAKFRMAYFGQRHRERMAK